MKDYEDETRDARRAAKAAEESPRMAKSELRAARKERDQYIARYSHITDAHPGTVVHVSNLQWQRMLYIRNPNRFFYLPPRARTPVDWGVKRRRKSDVVDEPRRTKLRSDKASRQAVRERLSDD